MTAHQTLSDYSSDFVRLLIRLWSDYLSDFIRLLFYCIRNVLVKYQSLMSPVGPLQCCAIKCPHKIWHFKQFYCLCVSCGAGPDGLKYYINHNHSRQVACRSLSTVSPSPCVSSHLGLSSIHLVNSMIRSLSFVFGSQPRLFKSSPEMAYLTKASG